MNEDTGKKICFFAPNLEGGGAERVISILSKLFSDQGCNVELLLAEAKGPYLSQLPSEIKVTQLNVKKVILALPILISYLRKNQPHVLFTSHMHYSTIAIWAVKLAKTDTRIIIRQPTVLRSSKEKKELKKRLRTSIFMHSAKFADQVIVTSKVMAEEFIELSDVPETKLTIIYNPIPIANILELASQPLDDIDYDINEPLTIIAVGRLQAVKDFSTLIKAFAIVHKHLPVRLLILGEGEQRYKLEALVQQLGVNDAVEMPGFVSNPYKYVKRSKVFVLSSLREGFPNSMVEAMACNINIVATDCDGGTAEILEYGKWGKLTPVRDAYAMAQAILETIDSSYHVNTVQRVQDFSLNKVFDQYCQVFNIPNNSNILFQK